MKTNPPPSSTNLLTACTSDKTQNTTTKVSIQFSVSRGQPPSTVLFCQQNKSNPVTPTYTQNAPSFYFRYTEQDEPPPSSTNLLTACTSDKTQNTTTKVSILFSLSRGQPPSTVLFCQGNKSNPVTPTYTHIAPSLFFRYTEQDKPPPSSTNLVTACTSDKTQNTTTKVFVQFSVSRGQRPPTVLFCQRKKKRSSYTYIHTQSPPLFF